MKSPDRGVTFAAVEGGETISKDEQVHNKRGMKGTPWKRGRNNTGIKQNNVCPVEAVAPSVPAAAAGHNDVAANTPKSILKNATDPLTSSVHNIAMPTRVSSDEAMKKVSWDANVNENNKFSFGRLNMAVINNFKDMAIGVDNKVHQAREKMQCGSMAAAKDFYCESDGSGYDVLQHCKRCEDDLNSLAMNGFKDDDSDFELDKGGNAVGEAREGDSEPRESETGCVEMREDEDMGMVTLVYDDPDTVHPRRSAPEIGEKENMTKQHKKASKKGKGDQSNRRFTTRQPKQRKKGLKGALKKPFEIMTVGIKMKSRKRLSNERYEM